MITTKQTNQSIFNNDTVQCTIKDKTISKASTPKEVDTVLAYPIQTPINWMIGQKPSKWRSKGLSKTNASLIWSKSIKKGTRNAIVTDKYQPEMDQKWSVKIAKSK